MSRTEIIRPNDEVFYMADAKIYYVESILDNGYVWIKNGGVSKCVNGIQLIKTDTTPSEPTEFTEVQMRDVDMYSC